MLIAYRVVQAIDRLFLALIAVAGPRQFTWGIVKLCGQSEELYGRFTDPLAGVFLVEELLPDGSIVEHIVGKNGLFRAAVKSEDIVRQLVAGRGELAACDAFNSSPVWAPFCVHCGRDDLAHARRTATTRLAKALEVDVDDLQIDTWTTTEAGAPVITSARLWRASGVGTESLTSQEWDRARAAGVAVAPEVSS